MEEIMATEEMKRRLNILKKAEEGDGCAQYLMGKSFEEKGDYTEAFAWYMKSARLNSLEELSKYYNFIFGELEDDFDEGYEEFPGYCEGVCALGNLFLYGKGVEKNFRRAFMCFVLASGEDSYYEPSGSAIYENDEGEDCCGSAQYYGGVLMQGICYFEGFGVEQNYELGFRLINEAQDEVNDSRLAWRYIGMACLDGKGTKQNEAKAFEYFKLAAECEDGADITSQYYVGFCYENGRGVEKNRATAKEWYQKAAAQGNEEAMLKLAGE